MPVPFPFSAIVGQDEMKHALLIGAVDSRIGGVLVFGDRGTGKSTAIRGLAALLPKMRVVADCRYGCDPAADVGVLCAECRERATTGPQDPPGAGAGGRSAPGRDRGPGDRCPGPGDAP